MALNPVVIGIGTEFDERGLKEAMRQMGDFQKKNQSLGEKFKATERGFRNVGLAMTAVTAGIGLAIKGAVDAAVESQKVARETEALIKTTGGAANVTAQEVQALSDALSLKIGVDDEVIQSSLNMLLTFKQVQNVAGEGNDIFNQAADTIQDMAAKFGNAEAQAVRLGKALSDPIKGVTALQRVGINFTQSQRDQIKALVETGDTLSAQKIILAEIESQVGGTAEATANGFDRMRVAVDNVKERFGEIFLPVLEAFANFVTNSVLPRIQGLIDRFKGLSEGTQRIIFIFGALVAATGPLLIAISLVMTTIRVGLQSVTRAFLTNPIGLIIAGITLAIAGLIAIFVQLYQSSEFLRNALGNAFGAIKNAISAAVGIIVEAFRRNKDSIDSLKASFTVLGNFIGKFIVPILTEVLVKAIGFLARSISLAIDSIAIVVRFVSGIITDVVSAAEDIINFFIDGYNKVGPVIAKFKNEAFVPLDKVIFTFGNNLRDAGYKMNDFRDSVETYNQTVKNAPTPKIPPDDFGPKVETAKEKVLKLDASLRGLFRRAVEVGSGLKEFGGDALAAFANRILDVGKVTEKTAKEFDDLVSVIRGKFDDALAEGKRRLDEATQAFNSFRDEVAKGIASEANFSTAAQAQTESIKALEDALKQQAEAQEKVIEAQESGDEDALAKANKDLADANRLLASARSNQRSFLDFLRVGVTQAEAFASQVTALTNAGASLRVVQQIVSLGATVGGRVAAELLAGGSAAIQEANRLLAVVDSVSQAAGIVAAKRFFQGGIDAANAFIEAIKLQMQALNPVIDDILRRLQEVFDMRNRAGVAAPTPAPAAPLPPPPVSIGQVARIPEITSDVQITSGQFSRVTSGNGLTLGFLRNFAKGGIVQSPTAGLLGEAGPEAVIPLKRGGIGATYNITVNAGMGANGAELGRAVVEAIRKYEKIAGQQFAGV